MTGTLQIPETKSLRKSSKLTNTSFNEATSTKAGSTASGSSV